VRTVALRFTCSVVVALALACTKTRTVSEGAECTSPYESPGVRLACAAPDRCLLMPSTPPGPAGARPYLCVRSCKSDADCAALGAYRCEHYDGHGDEQGCVPR
jgi:hypothetical protein